MGGGMAADLTHGAVPAMVSGLAQELGSVLQVVGAPGPAPARIVGGTGQFGVLLSDGVHSLEAVLSVTMNGLVTAGLLRAGSVVRVLDYLCSYAASRRVFLVFQLEVLQTECTLIGSPAIYEANDAAQPKTGSYSDRLGICRPRLISKIQQGVSKIARSRDQGLAGSSHAASVENAVNDNLREFYGLVAGQNTIDAKMQQLSLSSYQGLAGSSHAASVENAVNNLREFYGLVAAQNTIDAKMQQLPLSSYQGHGLSVPPTGGEGFDCADNTYRTIAQIKDESFRMSSQPDLITVVAAISQVDSDSFCYPSCALMFDGEKCNNKVKVDGDGWWCTRCLWRSQTCEYRYMLKCQISDHTGSTNATVLQEAAEEIIGHTAQELLTVKDVKKDAAKFERIMQGILWRQRVLKLRVEGHGVMMKRSIVESEKLESPNTSHLLGAIGNLLKSDSSPTPWEQSGVAPTTCHPTNLQAQHTFRTSYNSYGSMRSTRGASYGRPADQLPYFSTPPSAHRGMMSMGGASYRHTADQLPQILPTPPSAYGSMISTGDASYLHSAGQLPHISTPPSAYRGMMSMGGAIYLRSAGQLPLISTPPSAYGSMMSTGGATYRHMAYQLPQILSTPPSAYGSMMSTGDASYWPWAGYLPQIPAPLLGTRII